MSLPPPATAVLLAVIVILAAIWDLRWRRIPNWLTLAGMVLGIALSWFLDVPGLGASLQGLGVAFAIYFLLYLLRGMGAGDVKLMAAVGATAGLTNWLGIFFLTAVVGGVVGVLMVITKGRFRATVFNMLRIVGSLGRGRAPYKDNPDLDIASGTALRLPHGVMIALGTLGFLAAAFKWAPK
jgi:prepilin peptidase CpaA